MSIRRFLVLFFVLFASLPGRANAEIPAKGFFQAILASGFGDGYYITAYAFEQAGTTNVQFALSVPARNEYVFCSTIREQLIIQLNGNASNGSMRLNFADGQCIDGISREIYVQCESDGSYDATVMGNGTVSTFTTIERYRISSRLNEAKCNIQVDGVWYYDVTANLNAIREVRTSSSSE